MSIETLSPHNRRPGNFADKVRVYQGVPPTPEVRAEFERLAAGEENLNHFGTDWRPEDFADFLKEISGQN